MIMRSQAARRKRLSKPMRRIGSVRLQPDVRRNLVRGQRVHKLEAWKPRKVTVGRLQGRAMFDRDCCQSGIHNEGSAYLPRLDQLLQDFPVALPWLQNPSDWLVEPGCHHFRRFCYRKRVLEDPWIG